MDILLLIYDGIACRSMRPLNACEIACVPAGEALATLVVNKLRGVVNAVAIKAPGFGERRKSLLQDIAIVTGAEYIAKDLGMKVETMGVESLGTARKVSSGPGLWCRYKERI